MTAEISNHHFFGTSKVFGKEADALTAVIRGLAIDNARNRLQAAAIAALTDSTGGTASALPYTVADVPVPTTAFDATSLSGVQLTAFNASLGKLANARSVLADSLNKVRGRLGLSMITFTDGTVAVAGTLPAQDLTATGATGASAADYATCVAAMNTAKSNLHKLLRALNKLLTAIGETTVVGSLLGNYTADYVMGAVVNPVAATVGTTTPSVSLAAGTAFLAGMANAYATMAAAWNVAFVGSGLGTLTDSTTGTASLDIANAVAAFVPYTTAGTDCAPKAGFDTLVGVWNNAVASVAQRVNLIAEMEGLGKVLTDSTGGTASTTLAAQSALTAVTGGTSCVDEPTAETALVDLKNNLSTLLAAVNNIGPKFGVDPIEDLTGGTASATYTLGAIPTTTTGNSGAANATVANTAATTTIGEAANVFATLAAALNKMLGSSNFYRPLSVVAGL